MIAVAFDNKIVISKIDSSKKGKEAFFSETKEVEVIDKTSCLKFIDDQTLVVGLLDSTVLFVNL